MALDAAVVAHRERSVQCGNVEYSAKVNSPRFRRGVRKVQLSSGPGDRRAAGRRSARSRGLQGHDESNGGCPPSSVVLVHPATKENSRSPGQMQVHHHTAAMQGPATRIQSCTEEIPVQYDSFVLELVGPLVVGIRKVEGLTYESTQRYEDVRTVRLVPAWLLDTSDSAVDGKGKGGSIVDRMNLLCAKVSTWYSTVK